MSQRPLSVLAVHQGGGMGGAPISLITLLAHLDRARFRPRVLFTEAGPAVEAANQRGVEASVYQTGGAFFYSAHARLGFRSFFRFVRGYPNAVRRARLALREIRPDVLHLNTSVLLPWGEAARREGVPVVWVVREVLGPNRILRHWQAGFIARRAERVVVTSESVGNCFKPRFRVQRVHNAIDLQVFSPEVRKGRAQVRRELGIADTDLVIVAVGSVQRPKGHWLLLDALGTLVAREPRTRLVLVCGGVDASYRRTVRGRLKRLAGRPLDNLDALLTEASKRGLRDRITVTGFTHDVARVLGAADILVFPSLEPEGFGRPIIEGMAASLPVVATDVGPSRELLADAGVLTGTDVRELANALDGLMQNQRQRELLGAAGRQRAEERFDLNQQVEAMSAVYESVAMRQPLLTA